jgi:hypothetical protein
MDRVDGEGGRDRYKVKGTESGLTAICIRLGGIRPPPSPHLSIYIPVSQCKRDSL